MRHLTGDMPPATIEVVPDDTDPRFNWTIRLHGGGTALDDGAALTHHKAIMEGFAAVREANPILDFSSCPTNAGRRKGRILSG
ncbi:hypothetical protein [Xanthobacter tagetidis]|uniref:hypothetical protein n=1 Tax=Xanthobacter tagetidis TaxID=60216 RepID=UPI00147311ED|nr:hypothetical protein [Xanthobacter tagetidis]MBB6308925.1 hypothetical protein [Xanthobacter tagetidis]